MSKKKEHTCVHGMNVGRLRKDEYEFPCPKCVACWQAKNAEYQAEQAARRETLELVRKPNWCDTCGCQRESWGGLLCPCQQEAKWEEERAKFFANPRYDIRTCTACDGRGNASILVRMASWLRGEKRKEVACTTCRGTGWERLPHPTCPTCGVLYGTCYHTQVRVPWDYAGEDSPEAQAQQQAMRDARDAHGEQEELWEAISELRDAVESGKGDPSPVENLRERYRGRI